MFPPIANFSLQTETATREGEPATAGRAARTEGRGWSGLKRMIEGGGGSEGYTLGNIGPWFCIRNLRFTRPMRRLPMWSSEPPGGGHSLARARARFRPGEGVLGSS